MTEKNSPNISWSVGSKCLRIHMWGILKSQVLIWTIHVYTVSPLFRPLDHEAWMNWFILGSQYLTLPLHNDTDKCISHCQVSWMLTEAYPNCHEHEMTTFQTCKFLISWLGKSGHIFEVFFSINDFHDQAGLFLK